AFGLDDEVVAPEALQPCEWRRSGAEDADLPTDFGGRERRERGARRMVSLRQLDVREERQEQMRVGRIAERLAKPQLGVGERGMVLLHRGTDRLVIGPGRLNGDDTGPVAPAYAPRGLRHELERPLGRAA